MDDKLFEELHSRNFTLAREAIDQDKRTAEFSFSSETPVLRYWGIEILSHSRKSIRLDRWSRGVPFLMDHDLRDQRGVIQDGRIEGKALRGIVRFSRSQRGEELFQDVADGIRTETSIGYAIHKLTELREDEMTPDVKRMCKEKKTRAFLVEDWEPIEGSSVSSGADPAVGLGRSWRQFTADPDFAGGRNQYSQGGNMEQTVNPPAITAEDLRKEREAERSRIAEISELSKRFTDKIPDLDSLRQSAIEKGTSIDDFRRLVLEKIGTGKPIEYRSDREDNPDPVHDKAAEGFSLLRAISQVASNGRLEGLEREMTDQEAKDLADIRTPRGFFIPAPVLRQRRDFRATRALTSTDATKGGYTIGTDVLGGDMIELLRNKTMVAQMGARTLSGLKGNVAIPRITGGATAYWLAANQTVTASDQAFGQLALLPHRLVGDTAFDKELVVQSSIDVENFVREDLMRVLAIAKDLAAISGLGSAGQPLGILNTPGLSTSVTFGGAATWAKVIEFETNVATSNADSGSLGYLTTPAVRGKWKGISKVTNAAAFLWENGTVNGYRAEATNQMSSGLVLFGNWADAIFAEWAGIDVVVDPYSLKKTGQIEVTVTLWADFGVRHPASFAKSADSGAQ